MLASLSDLLNSNIFIAKIYYTESNFPSKCDFRSEKFKNKHSLAPCEGIMSNFATLYLYNHALRISYRISYRIKNFLQFLTGIQSSEKASASRHLGGLINDPLKPRGFPATEGFRRRG